MSGLIATARSQAAFASPYLAALTCLHFEYYPSLLRAASVCCSMIRRPYAPLSTALQHKGLHMAPPHHLHPSQQRIGAEPKFRTTSLQKSPRCSVFAVHHPHIHQTANMIKGASLLPRAARNASIQAASRAFAASARVSQTPMNNTAGVDPRVLDGEVLLPKANMDRLCDWQSGLWVRLAAEVRSTLHALCSSIETGGPGRTSWPARQMACSKGPTWKAAYWGQADHAR